ncbi:MAG: hypothetical protein NUV55_09120 [Sulfuricaulis sp.]|uniref:hypothetical protein n=1 Tax=Sulfuricaulis sp. TaxID=2003553 RepID=UPI0025F9E4C8|nr:hypothetical protein [Sulfuricaulis sp.]MCR4347343.1 hypothetical protein [Sulfuricaulis sp.]
MSSIADQKPRLYGFGKFDHHQRNQGAYIMKMKTLTVAAAAMTLGINMLAPVSVRAEQDFTQYSNEELVQQRSQVRDMSEGDRARFQEEMQTRARNMSAEDRAPSGFGGSGQGAQDGQMRQRTGEDNDRGQGEMKRERTRAESGDGYGRGYESRQSAGRGQGGGQSAGMGNGQGQGKGRGRR